MHIQFMNFISYYSQAKPSKQAGIKKSKKFVLAFDMEIFSDPRSLYILPSVPPRKGSQS